MVDAGEQAEAVDDEDVSVLHILLRCIGIADDLAAFQEFFYLGEMILANDVRRNDEFPIFVFIKVLDEDFLIGGP